MLAPPFRGLSGFVVVPRRTHIEGAAVAPPSRGLSGSSVVPRRTRCWFWARAGGRGWERSRNVPWNQWFHDLRSYRGLDRRVVAPVVHPQKWESGSTINCSHGASAEMESGTAVKALPYNSLQRQEGRRCARR